MVTDQYFFMMELQFFADFSRIFRGLIAKHGLNTMSTCATSVIDKQYPQSWRRLRIESGTTQPNPRASNQHRAMQLGECWGCWGASSLEPRL